MNVIQASKVKETHCDYSKVFDEAGKTSLDLSSLDG
jgi:hypothetical protein